MKKIRFLFVLGFFVIIPGINSFSQVSISTDNSSAHPSAMLEVKSTDKGFLPPRVALTAVNSASPIASPATGLLVYNTANAGIAPDNVIPGYYYWNGTIWVSLSVLNGSGSGDILFWDGDQWTPISPGLPGQFLQLSLSGIPEWSGDAYATLSTVTVSAILTTTAVSGGTVSSDGGAEVTARGICWNTSPSPVITGNHTTDGSGTGTYASNLTGLTENTLYYVRSYATNSLGTSYGNELSFMTLTQPVVTTAAVSAILTTTATCGGEVTFDGNSTATVRGVCWGITSNPDISGTHTTDGNGEGSFVSNLTGLTEGTLYYVRAYATNSAGTTYGNEISLTTSISDIDGNIYKTVKIGSQIWMVENLKTTRLNDGTLIPNGFSSSAPSYLWYNNNIANKDLYGALYSWPAAGSNKLAPSGWHVASFAEWVVLVDYLGGAPVGMGKLKETGTEHWQSPNTGATNEVGFTALPGGWYQSGSFMNKGIWAHWWTTPDARYTAAWYDSSLFMGGTFPGDYYAFSVRCIKN